MSPASNETAAWSARLTELATSAAREYVDAFDAERHGHLAHIAVQLNDGDTARWACALEGLAKTGWSFTTSSRQRDIYSRVMDLAREMNNGQTFFGPAEIARNSDMDSMFTRYKTPGVAAFGLVLNEHDEILLVQRRDNKKWAPPGGFCDAGYSGAETAANEVEQETGIVVKVDALVGVFDSLTRDNTGCQYALIFKTTQVGGELKVNEAESFEAGWFSLEDMPAELHHKGDPWLDIARSIVAGTFTETYFDQPRPAIIDVREPATNVHSIRAAS